MQRNLIYSDTSLGKRPDQGAKQKVVSALSSANLAGRTQTQQPPEMLYRLKESAKKMKSSVHNLEKHFVTMMVMTM